MEEESVMQPASQGHLLVWPSASGQMPLTAPIIEWDRAVSGHRAQRLPQLDHFPTDPSCQCHSATMVSLSWERKPQAQQRLKAFHKSGHLLEK